MMDQLAQSPIQPDLECFQGEDIDHLSGHPVSECHHLHCLSLGVFFKGTEH